MRKPKDPNLLSPTEAAALLGVDVSTLREWARQGKVPTVWYQGHRYFDRRDLERFGQEAKQLDAARAVNLFLALFSPKLKMIFCWRNGRERGIAPSEWPEEPEP